MPRLIVSGPVLRRACRAPSWGSRLAQRLRGLLPGLFDRYRPELHYMRGPGPKWRAKHRSQGGAHTPRYLAELSDGQACR